MFTHYSRDIDRVRTHLRYALNPKNEWDHTFKKNSYFIKQMIINERKHDLNMINGNITQLFIEKIMQSHLTTDFY